MREALLRLAAALGSGMLLGFAFLYFAPRTLLESLGEFVGRVFGLGAEGAAAELLIVVAGTIIFFSCTSWLVLLSWGSLRRNGRDIR